MIDPRTTDEQPLPREKLLRVALGVALTSAALVALEIVLTRVLSIRNHYHLAFLLISLAMLGLGASGSYLAVARRARAAEPLGLLVRYAALFCAACLLFAAVGTWVPSDPIEILHRGWRAAPFLPLYTLLLFLPFFFAGAAIGLALSRFPADVNRIYFADLVGAGVGCLAAMGLVTLLGAGGAVVACGLLGLGGAALFERARRGTAGRAIPIVIVVLAGLLPLVAPRLVIQPGLTKFIRAISVQNPDARIVYTEWTPTGRVDVQQLGEDSRPFMVLGLGAKAEGRVPRQKLIHVDGEATTQLNRFKGDLAEMRILRGSLYSAAYQILDRPEVLVIGVGGGTDVLAGLLHDARHITGVELNRPTIRAAANLYRDFAGGIYNRPDVTIVHGEGRAFVRRDRHRYDLIQLTGVDTHAALASGAYTLSENYLYTTEAMEDFVEHLAPGGVLSFMRWIFDPPRESLRLVTMAAEALARRGVPDAQNHIAVLRNGTYQGDDPVARVGARMFGAVLVKPDGFSEADVQKLEAFADRAGMEAIHLPHRPPRDNAFAHFLTATDRATFFRDYPFRVEPATDDSPFFYNYYRWKLLPRAQYGRGGPLLGHLPVGQIVLLLTAVQGLVFGVALILGPLFLFARRGLTARRKPSLVVYFSALGFGFMFIELAALQKFILFLDHPAYATSVVLFAMLVFAGLGSYASGRWRAAPETRTGLAALAVAVLVGFNILGLPAVLSAALGWPLALRIPLAVALLAPLGFALGVPFPAGLAAARAIHPGLVPWAWGINGCTSVLGAIGAVFLAMGYGFRGVFAGAAALYLLAALAIRRMAGRMGGK